MLRVCAQKQGVHTHVCIFPKGTQKAELAGKFCPCSPKIDYKDKIIIHNSFIDQERIEKSINENFKS